MGLLEKIVHSGKINTMHQERATALFPLPVPLWGVPMPPPFSFLLGCLEAPSLPCPTPCFSGLQLETAKGFQYKKRYFSPPKTGMEDKGPPHPCPGGGSWARGPLLVWAQAHGLLKAFPLEDSPGLVPSALADPMDPASLGVRARKDISTGSQEAVAVAASSPETGR